MTKGIRSRLQWLRRAAQAEPIADIAAAKTTQRKRPSAGTRRMVGARLRPETADLDMTNVDAPVAQREIRIVIVEDVPEVAGRIRELLRSQDLLTLAAVVTDGRRVVDEVAELRPDVVLVDVLLQGRVKGPAVIKRLRRARSPIACVAMTVPDRPIEDGLRESVDAVLPLPFGTLDLVRAVRDAMAAAAARHPTLASRVVAIFSAKGGVGKTTIAYNLAVAIGQAGLRTALVDGSLQYGDLRRLLKVPGHAPSICDLPTDSVRTSDLESLMVRDPSGIEILFAPPRLEMAELITTRDLDKILTMLRRTYHAVVVDTSSSLGETTLAMLDAADVVIQVVTAESATLDSTRAAADAFLGIGYPAAKLQLLVNRADAQGSLTVSQLRRSFGRDPDYTVASDWALVRHSNSEGVPFVLARPDAPVSLDIGVVADRICAIIGVEKQAPVGRRARTLARARA